MEKVYNPFTNSFKEVEMNLIFSKKINLFDCEEDCYVVVDTISNDIYNNLLKRTPKSKKQLFILKKILTPSEYNCFFREYIQNRMDKDSQKISQYGFLQNDESLSLIKSAFAKIYKNKNVFKQINYVYESNCEAKVFASI